MENRKERIENSLNKAFNPIFLRVIDDSSAHVGHAGARDGGESHYKVEIVSDMFKNMSRIEKHRLVYAALAEEMTQGIHALNIQASAPEK